MSVYRFCVIAVIAALLAFRSAVSYAQGDVAWEPNPGKSFVLVSEYGVESLSFRAASYSELEKLPQSVSFLLSGFTLASPQTVKLAGKVISELWLVPEGDKVRATVKLTGTADGFSINAAPSSRAFPNSSSVVVALTGLRIAVTSGAGSSGDGYPDMAAPMIMHDYDLPEFEKKYKYSDALVTIHTRGASIKGVLDYMALVGNLSIVLDPYWDQEPTGGGRPPISGLGGGVGEGGEGGSFGTGGGASTGFQGFGRGAISVDLDDVPFDLALDLIITSAGLVYFDIG